MQGGPRQMDTKPGAAASVLSADGKQRTGGNETSREATDVSCWCFL